jgi:thiol-disulfide isomerase/thioredoxin
MKQSILPDIIACFFILLFTYTGIIKLMEIHLFKEQLVSSPFIGALSGIIAWGLPITELLLVIGLIIPFSRLKAFYATLALMGFFALYVIVILFIDKDLTCSCGGIIEQLSPRQHILFNSACVALAWLAIRISRRQQPTRKFTWVMRSATLSLFLLVGWNLFTAFSKPATVKTGMEGRLLPSFNLLLVDSVTKLNTAEIPEGRPFIVIDFSPWCTHCQAETRNIIAHMQQLKNTRIYYVTTFPYDQMAAFYRYFKLKQYPNITMGRDTANILFPYFKGTGVPYTLVFDPKKRLRQVINGEANIDKLTQLATE